MHGFNCLLVKIGTLCLATPRGCPIAEHLCIFTNQYLRLPFPTLITFLQNQDALRHLVDTIGGKSNTRIWAFLVSSPVLRLVGNIFLEKNINCRIQNSVRRLFWIQIQMALFLLLDQILQVGIHSELTQNLLLLLVSFPSIHKMALTSRILYYNFHCVFSMWIETGVWLSLSLIALCPSNPYCPHMLPIALFPCLGRQWSPLAKDHRKSKCMPRRPAGCGLHCPRWPLHQLDSNSFKGTPSPVLGSSRCQSSAAFVGNAAAQGSAPHAFLVLILPEPSRTDSLFPPSGLHFMLWWHFPAARALFGLLEKGRHFHLPIQDEMAHNYEPIYIYVWEESPIEGCITALEFGHMFIHSIFRPGSNSSLAEMKTSSCRAVPSNSLQKFSPGSIENYIKL